MASTRPASSSPKRPRSPSPPPSPGKKRRVSPPTDATHEDALRVALETLRDENRELLEARESLKIEKKTQEEQLAQAQRSLRDLEQDVARIYGLKLKQKDAGEGGESKEINESKDINNTVPDEMDRFLQRCELWQSRLRQLSGQLEDKLIEMETQEVTGVVQDLVTKIEVDTVQDQLQRNQSELQWAKWFQVTATDCLKDAATSREETEVFEAVEKQLMNDRVVELETQLAQKRAVEREKEMELSSLRADQEEMMHSSHVVPNDEFETLTAEKQAMDVELKQLKETTKHLLEEVEGVKQQRDDWKQQNQKLMEEAEKQNAHEFEATERNMTQDEEIKKLRTQLQEAKVREEKMATALNGAKKEIEKGKQRKEELKILYARFSRTMDSASEKAMRLEELEQELKDTKSNLQAVEKQNAELEKQVTHLQQESSDLSAAHNREKDVMKEELIKVQKQYTELKELESLQMEFANKMQSKITELEAQNEVLTEQQFKREHQSVGQPSNEGDKRSSLDSDDALVIQVSEKEALKFFVQRYYFAAEEKCSKLIEKVGELKSQKTTIQEQTKESCRVLRMCTQVDTCDESVRATLLDVMATLEGLT